MKFAIFKKLQTSNGLTMHFVPDSDNRRRAQRLECLNHRGTSTMTHRDPTTSIPQIQHPSHSRSISQILPHQPRRIWPPPPTMFPPSTCFLPERAAALSSRVHILHRRTRALCQHRIWSRQRTSSIGAPPQLLPARFVDRICSLALAIRPTGCRSPRRQSLLHMRLCRVKGGGMSTSSNLNRSRYHSRALLCTD